jgi:hypothetical protein
MVARTRLARWLLPALGVLAVSAPAPEARADETASFGLAWNAPSGCPGETALRSRIEQLRGEHAAAPPGTPTLEVRAVVTLLPDARFHAVLELVQGGSRRSRVLEAPTCTDVAEASAAVIALAIAPPPENAGVALAMPPLETSRPLPAPPAAAAVVPSASGDETRRPAPAERRAALGIDVSAGATLDLGATASVALGLALLGRLRVGRLLSFALRGSFFPPRASSLPREPNQGVELWLAAAAPLACASPFELPFELDACAEFELGYLHARGFGPPLRYARGVPWLAPGAGLSTAFPRRGRVRSRLSGDLLFPLNHTEFVLTNVGVARRLPVVAPRVGLYLELAFP